MTELARAVATFDEPAIERLLTAAVPELGRAQAAPTASATIVTFPRSM